MLERALQGLTVLLMIAQRKDIKVLLRRDISPPSTLLSGENSSFRAGLTNMLLGLLFFSFISIETNPGRAQPFQTAEGEPLRSRTTGGEPLSPPLGWGWRIRPTEPINLSAHRGRFNGLEQELRLEGEVRLQQGNQQLSCASLTLQLDEGYRPLRLSASGALSLRSDLGDLRGDELSVDLQRGTLELRGSVELRRDGVRLQAAKLQLDTQRRQLTLERLRGTLRLRDIPAFFSRRMEGRPAMRRTGSMSGTGSEEGIIIGGGSQRSVGVAVVRER